MFQIRFGRKIRNAAMPPSQSHLFKSAFRCLVTSRPTTIAKPKTAIEYFSSKPSPATTPNQSQNRGSRLIARIAKYSQPIQNSGSRQLEVGRHRPESKIDANK